MSILAASLKQLGLAGDSKDQSTLRGAKRPALPSLVDYMGDAAEGSGGPGPNPNPVRGPGLPPAPGSGAL